LILDLWLAENTALKTEKVLLPFDQILPAIARGEVDAGLHLHEGQLTLWRPGNGKIWDAGEWWNKKTGLLCRWGWMWFAVTSPELAKEIDVAFRKSILFAQAHPKEALAYALPIREGTRQRLGQNDLFGMYVNEDTLAQGTEVHQGLERLYHLALRRGIHPS